MNYFEFFELPVSFTVDQQELKRKFYALSNGGFYMSPISNHSFQVICDNGFEGSLSGDALGITVCLYAYSHLSFSDNHELAEKCLTISLATRLHVGA